MLAAEPLCRACRRAGRLAAATEVDHILPIVQRPDLAYDRENLQPLCAGCHRLKSARDARRRRPAVRLDAAGWPVAPAFDAEGLPVRSAAG